MVRNREQARPPPVAGEQQRPGRQLRLPLEEGAQVLVRGGRVPHVELDGLPHLDPVPYRERPALRVHPYHCPDQEVPALQLGLVLVDDTTHVEAPTDQLAVFGPKRSHQFLQSLEGRPTSQLVDDVPLRPRHGVDIADGAASLGDERPDPDPGHAGPDRAGVHHTVVQEQPGVAGPHPAASHPAHHDRSGNPLVHMPEQ